MLCYSSHMVVFNVVNCYMRCMTIFISNSFSLIKGNIIIKVLKHISYLLFACNLFLNNFLSVFWHVKYCLL